MANREEMSISSANSPKQVLIQLVHDFRASIAALYGYATVIQRNPHDTDVEEWAGEIQKVSRNLQAELRLVENYLRAIKNEIELDDNDKWYI